ncbi:MAG: polyamine aminopropyltransferase [Candidatus Aminicenantes bacterium]|jgi:spermidine synthase
MSDEENYYTETYTENLIRRFKIDKLYYRGKTDHQYVECFRNQFLGKVLFLDEKMQSAQVDEYIYHESLVHPALITHPEPRQVLILGGGEGATLRETLKHRNVEKATMVDIDKQLVALCREYLPEWSEGAFASSKTDLVYGDARRFIEATHQKYDAIISDLTEPLEKGPSVYLFTEEFFSRIFEILEKDGVFVLQAGSTDPVYSQFYSSLTKTLEKVFSLVRPYWTFVISFALPWGFILASKSVDPLDLEEDEISKRMHDRKITKLKFYHPGLHRGYFALPLYLMKDLKKGRILTDKKPFIWEL